jgi:glycosyltransferase involved in cell wall biosynthesis
VLDCISIITNYRRPWNIEAIIQSCMAADLIAKIILIDNAPDHEIHDAPYLTDPKVEYRRMGYNAGAGYRVALASDLRCDVVACLDDDIFLSPDQIDALARSAFQHPSRLHGVWGQRVETLNGAISLSRGVTRFDGEIDIINCAYFYTPEHARKAISLSSKLGHKAWSEIGPIDDILLSYAGDRRPYCHDFGPFQVCPSWKARSVAEWRKPGFDARRISTVPAILDLRTAT